MDPLKNLLRDLIWKAMRSAPHLCAGLIDQGHTIGGDPVGRACGNAATETVWAGGLGWRVCPACAADVRAGGGRVLLPLWRAKAGEG